MSKLVGVWDVSSSENWDEYLKEIGVGLVLRKTAGSVKPTVTLENSGDEWTMKVSSTLKSSELKFTVGVQFEESTMDGRKCLTTFVSEGPNKLVQTQVDAKTGAVGSVITREVVGEEMVQTLVAGKVTCVRKYKRTQ